MGALLTRRHSLYYDIEMTGDWRHANDSSENLSDILVTREMYNFLLKLATSFEVMNAEIINNK